MSDDGVLRRFPADIRPGNGIAITYSGGVPTISADLSTLTVTPTDAAAPVLLADTLAHLIANDRPIPSRACSPRCGTGPCGPRARSRRSPPS